MIGKKLETLGYDIHLDVKFLSFDKSEVAKKGQILLEQAKKLPVKIDTIFIEKARVPCGGYIHISLMAKRSASRRNIFDECKKIPAGKWYSSIGTVFNNCQKAIQHVPWVGKPVEKMVPDAFQTVKLSCELSTTDDKTLTYSMRLTRKGDGTSLLFFQGKFLFE